MAPPGACLLQVSMDDPSSAAASSSAGHKAGNTDVIRTMLREQKKECSALRVNPLFREFRTEANKQKRSRGAGKLPDAAPPVIDDLEAEGQTRLFEVIHQAASDGFKEPVGVWASFGKPYACFGEPMEPDGNLPKLNRDDMDGGQQRRAASRKAGIGAAMAATGPSVFKRSIHTSFASQKTYEGQQQHVTREDEEEATLLRHKTILQYATLDRLETSFPKAPLKQAQARLTKAKTRSGAFYDRPDADADVRDAAGAYGHYKAKDRRPKAPVQPRGPSDPSHSSGQQSHGAADAGAGLHGDKKSFFITQRGGKEGAAAEEDVAVEGSGCLGSVSSDAMRLAARGGCQNRRAGPTTDSAPATRTSNGGIGPNAPNSATGLGSVRSGVGVGAARATMTPQMGAQRPPMEADKPDLKALTELARPKLNDDSPVTDWHNSFKQTRQAGRAQLQQQLWERSQARHRGRQAEPVVAGLSSSLLKDMDASRGHLAPCWVSGTVPTSIFAKAERLLAAPGTSERQKDKGLRTLKQDEVALLERFYDRLCALVEQQRISDALSLLIVHRVKALLEGGTFLHRPLLLQVLDHVAGFVKGCGLLRYNRYAMPILTFVRKCVGVSEDEFASMVDEQGLWPVLLPPAPADDEGEHDVPYATHAVTIREEPSGSCSITGDDAGDDSSGGQVGNGGMAAAHAQQGNSRSNSRQVSRQATRQATRQVTRQGSRGHTANAAPAHRRNASLGAESAWGGETTGRGQDATAARGGEASSSSGAANATQSGVPMIDTAAAVAAAELAEAVASAPNSHRSVTIALPGEVVTSTRAGGAGKQVTIARTGSDALGQQLQGTAASRPDAARRSSSTCSGRGSAGGSGKEAEAAAVDDEPLPDIGLGEDGALLSHRRQRAPQAASDWVGKAAAPGG